MSHGPARGSRKNATRLPRDEPQQTFLSGRLALRFASGVIATGVIARELPCHATAARSAQQRPLQRLLPRSGDLALGAAQLAQPVGDDVEIGVLVKRVERDPQPEAL